MPNKHIAKLYRLSIWEAFEEILETDGLCSGIFDVDTDPNRPIIYLTWTSLKHFETNYSIVHQIIRKQLPDKSYLICHSLHKETTNTEKSFLFMTSGGCDGY